MTNTDLIQAFVSGRAACKAYGMQINSWPKIDHDAHMRCIKEACESINSPNTFTDLMDIIHDGFTSGDADVLACEVMSAIENDGSSAKWAACFADGVRMECRLVLDHIKNLGRKSTEY